MSKQGRIIVISGPSGAGKTTLIDRILNNNTKLKLAISATTRPKRETEVDKEDYFFLSDNEFDTAIQNDQFLEWCPVHQHRYGTLKKEVEKRAQQGHHVILEIDVQGARKVKGQYPSIISIFIKPPSLEILKERLENRKTDSQDTINKRLAIAKKELEAIDEYEHIIENNSLDESTTELLDYLEAKL